MNVATLVPVLTALGQSPVASQAPAIRNMVNQALAILNPTYVLPYFCPLASCCRMLARKLAMYLVNCN